MTRSLLGGRLRARLVLIALVALVPSIAAISLALSIGRERSRDRVIAANLSVARLAADQEGAVFDGARRLLQTLAVFPPLRTADPRECNELLPTILRLHPNYFNVSVVNADGTIFCRAVAPADSRAPSHVRGRTWFGRAMQSRDTVVGDYQLSATTGRPAVIVAQPLLGPGGHVVRVIEATISVASLLDIVSRAKLPSGATMTLFDRTRTILARVPDDDQWVGKQVPDGQPLARLIAGASEDVSEAVGVDGTRRFYITIPLRASVDTGLYLGMGVDRAAAFAEANHSFRLFASLLLIVSAAAVAASIIAGHLFVIKPVRAVTRVAQRLAQGDLSARTDIADGIGGIGELEDAVNVMASALDARQRDRDRAETALVERITTTALTADVGVSLNRTVEIKPCLQNCAESLIAHLDAAGACIWTMDAAGHALELQAMAGVTQSRAGAFERLDLAASAIGRIARERRPHLTNAAVGDPLIDDQPWLAAEALTTFVGYPLLVDSRVLGVVALFGRTPLSEVTMTAVGSTADLVALGIARHQAEAARRLLAAIVEDSEDAIVGSMLDGTIISWNAGAQRLFGYTSDQIVGQSVVRLYPAENRPEFLTLQQSMRSGRHVTNRETVRVGKDGSLVPVAVTLSPIRDAAGDIAGVSTTLRNITERLRAERALRDAEERMRFALESSNVGVWETNLKSGLSYWSDTCQRMHGLAAGAFAGTFEAFLDRIDPDDREQASQAIERAVRDHTDAQLEYRTTWPDGTVRWISAVGRFFYDEAGVPTRGAGIAVDITEKRSLEDQLRQSQKMEAIGQLAGGVAHDFNNLLTAILGFAGFVADTLPDDDRRRTDLEEIRTAAERAATLTRQLLAFSRKQILAARVLHLGDVVGELTPMLRRLLGESIDLATTVGDRGVVKADPGQLQQVLLNLAVNARDAMGGVGRLTIATSDVTLDRAFVQRHPSSTIGAHVLLRVTDTGRGMDAAVQKRIFEPFFTTKPQGQGTGLGLATVYGIVKQSGGSIWVQSEPGRGTTFTVYLPQTDEREEAAAAPAAEPRAKGGTETILLVEDEVLVREWVYKVLSRRGYSVHAFGEPERAISYADAHPSTIDLVLSDVVLPEMSGKAMVAQLRARHPESKVVFMSGYADHAIVQQGVLGPGTWFLQKPFTADAVARTVRDVIDAARPS